MKDNVRVVGAAFLVGGIVGTALALLFAPQSGRETRKDISKTARRVKNKAVDVLEETIEDVDDFVDNLREVAADIMDQGMDLSDKARKEIAKTLAHGQSVIEKQRKKISESLGL
jgi:gas vesicle protein